MFIEFEKVSRGGGRPSSTIMILRTRGREERLLSRAADPPANSWAKREWSFGRETQDAQRMVCVYDAFGFLLAFALDFKFVEVGVSMASR
jgi:hypothetical protein